MRRTPTGERGFALLTALWFLVVVTATTASLLAPLRVARLQAARLEEDLLLERAARNGLAELAGRLSHRMASRRRTDQAGIEEAMAFLELARAVAPEAGRTEDTAGCAAALQTEDAEARLHLGRASGLEIQRLLLALGLPTGAAARAGRAIEAGRSGRQEGSLLLVDLDPDLRAVVEPYVTASGPGRVNLNTAPEPVLRALPGMSDELVARILHARAAGAYVTGLDRLADGLTAPARTALVEAVPALRERVSFAPRVLRVAATGRCRGAPGRMVRLEALLMRSGSRLTLTEQSGP